MSFEELKILRNQLIDIKCKQEINSDMFIKCNEALDVIEDLMADMMIANGKDFQDQELANLFKELAILQTDIFNTLGFFPLAKH
jgi:hypothetical protein